jgi:thioredoxin-like negative regulator of GroEL
VVSGDALDRSFRSVYDLRVDEHAQPLTELARLVRLRGGQLISQRGNEALAEGDQEKALTLWTQAREQAPELEEIAFWQAMTLIDATGDAATAAEILRPALAGNARRDHWFDLITRLIDCGLVENGGVAAQVQDAL